MGASNLLPSYPSLPNAEGLEALATIPGYFSLVLFVQGIQDFTISLQVSDSEFNT